MGPSFFTIRDTGGGGLELRCAFTSGGRGQLGGGNICLRY